MNFSTFTNSANFVRFSAFATLRGWVKKRAAKTVLGLAVLMNAMAPASFAGDVSRSEYEEWGLTPPTAAEAASRPTQATEAPATDQDADWSEQLGPANTELAIPSSTAPQQSNTPAQNTTPAPVTPAVAQGPAVPADVAAQVEGATIRVIVVDAKGEHLVVPGWLIDRNRGIVMTMSFAIEGAQQIYVAFPEMTETGREFNGGPATVMQTNNKEYIAYLQVQEVPAAISGLLDGQAVVAQRPVQGAPVQTPPAHQQNGGLVPPRPAGIGQNGHGGRPTGQPGFGPAVNRPVAQTPSFGQGGNAPQSQNNPVVGQWVLQDVVNGTQIQMGAAFNAQGQFSVQVMTVSPNGQQSQDAESGTYSVQGNTLLLNTSDGVEQAPFWFEGGYLYIQLPSMGTTFAFQQAA